LGLVCFDVLELLNGNNNNKAYYNNEVERGESLGKYKQSDLKRRKFIEREKEVSLYLSGQLGIINKFSGILETARLVIYGYDRVVFAFASCSSLLSISAIRDVVVIRISVIPAQVIVLVCHKEEI